MTVFRFTGVSASGAAQKGTMEAANAALVVARLQQQGLIPLRVETLDRGSWLGSVLGSRIVSRSGLSREELSVVTRELATLLSAGEDVNHALQFTAETVTSKRATRVLSAVRDKVRGGSSLAVALSEPPANLPKLYAGLVRAGESSGALAVTLDHLAGLLERERSLAMTVNSALIYPSLLVVGATGTIYMLSRVVLPQFVPMFEQNNVPMPLPTRLLMAFGTGLATAGPWLLIGLAAIIFLGRRFLSDPVYRLPIDRALLRVPLIGSLLREVIAARFCRALGSLLGSGIPLIPALAITKDTLNNLAAADAIQHAAEQARGGASLTARLEEADLLPVRAMHLLKLGERTAQLAPLALKAAAMSEERVQILVQRMVSLLVPVITLALGAIVAAIIGSILLAMLSLNDLVH